MANQVKRSPPHSPLIGDRVSVPSTQFRGEFEVIVREKYQVEKILGTVKFKLSGKARIEWDSDGKSSEVAFEELLIEDKETPRQTFSRYYATQYLFSVFLSIIRKAF